MYPKCNNTALTISLYVDIFHSQYVLQNDAVLTKALTFILTPFVGGAKRSEFQRSLEKIQHATKTKVMQPYPEYEQAGSPLNLSRKARAFVWIFQSNRSCNLQEVEALCSSIALREKHSRAASRLQSSLAEIEAERHSNLAEKVAERVELQAAAEEIRHVRGEIVVQNSNVLNPYKSQWSVDTAFGIPSIWIRIG